MRKKTLAVVLILILIVNLVVFAIGMSSELVFWIIIIAIALIAYFMFSRKKGNI